MENKISIAYFGAKETDAFSHSVFSVEVCDLDPKFNFVLKPIRKKKYAALNPLLMILKF